MPGPKPKPKEELLVMVAGRVPKPLKAKVTKARTKRGWNESQFVRHAVELALRHEKESRAA